MTSSSYPMVGMTEALQSIRDSALSLLESLAVEWLNPCKDAHLLVGSPLVQEVTSPINVPAFRASIMDGYAVCAADLSTEENTKLTVLGGMLAGDSPDKLVLSSSRRCAVYVTTGGPVPDGADAVVKVEMTDKVESNEGGVIEVRGTVKPGQWIREVGSDVKRGDVVLAKGSVISPADIGLLVMLGIRQVAVQKRIRVGLISTGSELIDPNGDMKSLEEEVDGKGKIFDSNRAMLASALGEMEGSAGGIEVVDFGIVKDSVGELERALDNAVEKVDVLISTGGVSMGAADLVKPYFERKGKIVFGRLLMKPGKPATFSIVSALKEKRTPTLAFALPGNPVSAMVCYYLLAHPAIRILQGCRSNYEFPKVEVVLSQDISLDPERPEYHRAIAAYDFAESHLKAYSTGNQLSSRLLSMQSANVLLEIPQGLGKLSSGDKVQAIVIGNLVMNSSIPKSLIPSSAKAGCGHHHHHEDSKASSSSRHHHHTDSESGEKKKIITVGLVVCSDRASKGVYQDRCVEAISSCLSSSFQVTKQIIISDDQEKIEDILKSWCDGPDAPHVIFTMGGTGFSPRDVTPEATSRVIERQCNFHTAILVESMKIVPMAMLSRALSGIRRKSIIINLVGSPKGVKESVGFVIGALPHAVQLLNTTEQ
eukprot:TRINITY_DN6606_c0_g1_i1.p1 TRINITY_DN6606_c0_g1~~TRINITY_DN6606_c0_g1_i1.p1  ORF type:complete len:652 (+),score=197.69 TRINITY_DN6606_c0_g1_i1:84-2039(+)